MSLAFVTLKEKMKCCMWLMDYITVGIIRTMVAEMVPEKELQPRAFSIMPLVWSLGSVIGPSFGGFFAQPAKQYPAIFGDMAFFKQYPYALPNLVATIFFLISLASASLFLKVGRITLKGVSSTVTDNSVQ
jgi:MFS family permease